MRIVLFPVKNRGRLKPMKLEAFAKKHGLVMHVYERTDPQFSNFRWHAAFMGSECKSISPGGLESTHGNGATPKRAIVDYKRKLSGRTLVFDAMSSARREIVVPTLK